MRSLIDCNNDPEPPPVRPEEAGLPPLVRAQCRVFDALAHLNAAYHELSVSPQAETAPLVNRIGDICDEIDGLLDRMSG